LDSGTRIGLTMAPERTYFFDAVTGDARRTRERIMLS
jgi:sn-glycerol 3-phosphate transport system ATP-binding protein